MDEEVRGIARRIAERFKPKRVMLFGSRAMGTAKADSDIDLCVIEDSVTDKCGEIVQMRKMLGNVILPMDILIFSESEFQKRRNISGTVQNEIDKHGIVLYER